MICGSIPFHIAVIFGLCLIHNHEAFQTCPRLLNSSPKSTSLKSLKSVRSVRLFATVSKRNEIVDSKKETAVTPAISGNLLGPAIPYSKLTVGVLKETFSGENRVSQSPDSALKLVKAGLTVVVQSGAGEKASFPDSAYVDAGAFILPDEDQVIAKADIITKIRPPTETETPKLGGKTLIGLISPGLNSDLYGALNSQKTTTFALDCVPRMLSRAQAFDVLSSQANIAGYRAVIEAAEEFSRFFAGQMTAAGKVPPAKVLVLGVGVAGLAAIQTAKNMGAIVRAFDVRAVTKEQVESMGATFLEVPIKEDGAGTGGYAKEMSEDFKRAQAAMMLEQAKEVDIIITTALIPGRKAPILVNEEMLSVMKPGSVCVDLAAENGGNIAQTRQNEVVLTSNGVKIIGYTDMPSRLAATASNLFGNNVANFILSVGPQTTKVKNEFQIDLNDDAVQNMLISYDGIARWPDKITPFSLPPAPAPKEVIIKTPEETLEEKQQQQLQNVVKNTGIATLVAAALLTFGVTADSHDTVSLMSSFAIAGLAGYQVVWGVAPALHSPLMAVTNAISGLTALGGMILLAHGASGIIPDSPAHIFGAIATLLSFINISGGFLVSSKMLDLFRRPDDPEDFFGLYAIPVSVLIGGLGLSAVFHIGDLDNVANSIGVASAICCIISIALLSNQKTARTGNVLGISGVAFGLASTAAEMSVVGASPAAFAQAASLAGVGSLIGASLAKGVGPTELPQTVAAFHSLVGIAAMTAAAGEYYLNSGELQIGTLASIYLAVFIGGITATGSMVAFAKLAGMLGSKALNLPGRDQLNLSMVIISAIGMALFMFPSLSGGVILSDPESVRVACLSVVGLISSLLGLHLTASIGGADMPVVITVLNSYSGWALVAEGFLLGNPLLAQVGSLIGFSGAILTWIMCENMGRDIFSVILGGAGTASPPPASAATIMEGEITTSGVEGVLEALKEAKNIIIVPGYGLAVAQAQFAVAEIAKVLRERYNKNVRFGIHPVAGRMPGQLNVLLAEASVPYDIVLEMEEINDDFENTDVTLVIGASDTVSSAAEDDPSCSIYGMPVLKVWKSNKVFVLKRTIGNTGYTGMENPILFKDNADVVLGDAKATCEQLRNMLMED